MPAPSRQLKLIGAAALAALILAGCGGSKHKPVATVVTTVTTVTKPSAKPPPRSSMISIFGDPARLLTSPGPTLDTYRALGVDYARVTVPFAGLVADPRATSPPAGFDPSSPASYPADKWAPYDTIVREATARGLGVILDPGSPVPAWATGGGEPAGGLPYVWKPSAVAFGAFDSSLHPLQGSAATARGCPATASASKQFPSQNPALFRATGMAIHPYPQGALAPDAVIPDEPDYADLANLPKLERQLDSIQQAYGLSKRFDLYSTEFGYKTNPPTPLGPPLQQAAAYLNWSEFISWSDPRIRSYNQYLLSDPPPASSHFDTGLEFLDGTLKPSYAAFRLPIYLPVTRGAAGAALTVWGCVRPAHFAAGSQRARVEFDSGKGFKSLETVPILNRNGYVDATVRFPSSGSVRLAWSYPHGGPEIHSREVKVTIT